MVALPTSIRLLILMVAGWAQREQVAPIEYLLEENRVLREQLGSRRNRFTDEQRRRLALKGRALGRRVLEKVAGIVTPDTILRWYRQLVAREYDGSHKRRRGRPSTKVDIVGLLVDMAKENPTWGYTRLRDALHHLGHEISSNTVKRILADHGNGWWPASEPVPWPPVHRLRPA